MNLRNSALASVAAAAIFAAPVVAQNAVETVDNAILDVGNGVDTAANSIATTADNAVDIDVTTDPNVTAPLDDGLVVDDANLMSDPMMDGNMVTTTTTTREGSSGKGSWGLLGLLGLLSFLFRPKKAAIHLDERDGRV